MREYQVVSNYATILFNIDCGFMDKSELAKHLFFEGLHFFEGKNYVKAKDNFSRSLVLVPDVIPVLINLSLTLMQLGDLSDAKIIFKKIIALDEKLFDVWLNYGLLLMQEADWKQALYCFDKVVAGDINHIEAIFYRACALMKLQRYDEALLSYDKVLAVYPDNVAVLVNKATILYALKDLQPALLCYQRVLEIDPSHVNVWHDQGLILHLLKDYGGALISYNNALNMQLRSPELLSNTAATLNELKRYDESLVLCDQVLADKPNFVQAWLNKASALKALLRVDDALCAYDQALNIDADNYQVWCSKAILLYSIKRYDEAITCYQKALIICPDYVEASFNMASIHLLQMDFNRGWGKYCDRWLTKASDVPRLTTQQPLWEGRCSEDVNLLIWAEQGIGDQILYASIFDTVKPLLPKITLATDMKLSALFKRSFPDFDYVSDQHIIAHEAFNTHIPMAGLGKFFRQSVVDFGKAKYPYLFADQERVHDLRHKIQTKMNNQQKLICGLSWESKNSAASENKSIRLIELSSILNLAHCHFVDLQYGDTSVERLNIQKQLGIVINKLDEVDNYQDIDDLAALICACDIVVTISNTTAHLAGALGKDTLLLSPYSLGKFWYWHHINEVSLWYPSVRVFEQATYNDWSTPIGRAKLALEEKNVA